MSDPQDNRLPEGAPDDPLTGHNYDGIQEYDNPLPGWWKWLFVASILMAPPYFMYYHSGVEGRSLEGRYEQELSAVTRAQYAALGTVTPSRESVIRFLYDSDWLPAGASIFKTNCQSCHGSDGGGKVGPNLTDDAYKNVKDIGDILTVIQNGANGGAMPAWNTRLSEIDMVMVSSYVASLRGDTPADPKAPEGRPIPPWPGPPEQPSETTQESSASEDSEVADDVENPGNQEADTTQPG
jgi:cytochrome c oxidase cbb3-type subunit 3